MALDLQSLLVNPSFCSDVCLIKCFHDGCFKRHLDWMVAADDLTGVTGFQSHHQMVARCCKMDRDLSDLLAWVDDCNSFFHHFVRSLSVIDDHGSPLHDVDSQKTKALNCINQSIALLQKQFKRWLTPKLLPAASLTKKPLSMVLSRVIGGADAPWPAPLAKFDPTIDCVGDGDCSPVLSNGKVCTPAQRLLLEEQWAVHHQGLRKCDKLTRHH